MKTWQEELEYNGFTEGMCGWEKEFDCDYIGYVDVFTDEGKTWFEISVLRDGEIEYCCDDKYSDIDEALLWLNDEVLKLLNAWD